MVIVWDEEALNEADAAAVFYQQRRRLGCGSIATQRNREMLGCQKDGNSTYAAVAGTSAFHLDSAAG